MGFLDEAVGFYETAEPPLGRTPLKEGRMGIGRHGLGEDLVEDVG